MLNNILITGATGFIGKELVKEFDGDRITVFSRNANDNFNTLHHSLEDLLVQKCINEQYDVAIHLAGLAHQSYKLSELRSVNVDTTVALAKQLAEKGLRRFIFISSIGVNGNQTSAAPFTEQITPCPHADYAVSKFEAEIALTKLSKEYGFELVIIRPPLVYGKNAPGNFKKLYQLASKGIPLPFGLANNSRSFISVNNLCDFISLTTIHPKAVGQLFLVSDDEIISTKRLIKTIWKVKGVKSFLIPVPICIFKVLFKILGLTSMSVQLFDNLEIDNSKAKKLLGWIPKQSMIDALKQQS
jgi:nucleoside-diphosphate-sugar epimerase